MDGALPAGSFGERTPGRAVVGGGHAERVACQRGALPQHPSRNGPCPCGSHHKYKRCCQQRDEIAARRDRKAALPPWIGGSSRKLHQFEKYVCSVYGLPRLLRSFRDGRRDPSIPTFEVANSLFHAALFRLPSINALEGDLQEPDFQMQIGRAPRPGVKAFSAEVVSNVLDQMDLGGLRNGLEDVFWKAERNKAFREGSYGALRCVAIDGWEPFASYSRHCSHCLVRKVKQKQSGSGEVEEVDQYYHRYVIAMLLGPVLDVVLDIEPVRNAEARRDSGEEARHEGELTAAHRLIDRLHEIYRSFLDAFVFDALYANGPVMTQLDQYGYGGFMVLKKDDNQPLEEALALWQGEDPGQCYDDLDRKEHVEVWDAGDLETLETYAGKVRVLRAVVTKQDQTHKTWCFGIVGQRARKVSTPTALRIIRARWHLEDTGFHQWVQHWNLAHVYRHTPNALLAILLLWAIVFNLLQLFVYRRLKRKRRPKDPCDTIRHIVEVMLRDLGAITKPIPWAVWADTS